MARGQQRNDVYAYPATHESPAEGIPAEEPDELDLGEAWTLTATRQRDAIIQPPKPRIPLQPRFLSKQPNEKLRPDTPTVHPNETTDSSEVTHMADPVTPPGKARITPCPECNGQPGRPCHECHGQGTLLQRACPLCGDLAWDYINGQNEDAGMTCRLGCGYHWSAEDVGWIAQMLPIKSA